MKKAVRIYIFGTVQEIFFRNFVKTHADKLEINGYVRNKEDGSIEAWFEGDNEKVQEIIEMCKKGPEHSVINRLDIVEENFQGLKDFKILDEGVDEKGNIAKIISFTVQNMKEPLIFYNCFCPSSKREFFIQTEKKTWQEAKASSFGLREVEWVNEW